MLPFTTYSIPEVPENKTGISSKWLWFIIDKPTVASDSELMQKISTALKSNFKEDTVIHTFDTDTRIPLSDIHSSLPKLIISFGIPPASLGIWIDLQNQGMRVLESFTFILTLPLNELSGNANAKKELWKSMLNFMDR